MPIYEFVCETCGRLEERLQKANDPPPEACPDCGGKMAKIMSRNSFQLKGGGWYRDLYSSSSAKPASETKSETKTKSDTKTESETKTKTEGGAKPAAPTAAPAPPAKKD
jgi:putative FmdB family regulatory protein